jgi:protein-L-isoaspartate O-methyltransferase
MLCDLDLGDGMRVLEIGTGSGWNAGLLSYRLGGAHVVTVEVDDVLANIARVRLAALGLTPLVVADDGAKGHAASGPYDRITATCSVSRVPGAWVEQTRLGGLIVAPWTTGWTRYGTVKLQVRGDGSASGLFRPGGAFMPMRSQRSKVNDIADVLNHFDVPRASMTTLSPWSVAAGDDTEADFAIGLRLQDVWHTWDFEPEIDGVQTRLWLADEAGTSWATVDYDGKQLDAFTVRQNGTRRLWAEVESAWSWWTARGCPLPHRFGLTVHPDGLHRVWLDHEVGEGWTLTRPSCG